VGATIGVLNEDFQFVLNALLSSYRPISQTREEAVQPQQLSCWHCSGSVFKFALQRMDEWTPVLGVTSEGASTRWLP